MTRKIAFAVLMLAASSAAAQVRFDNWIYYQRNTDDSTRWQYRPRFYIPFDIGSGWTFTQRVDLPMYYTDRTGPENPSGEWKAGIGDWYVEESLTTPELGKGTRGNLGVRFVFPTGGLSPFGSGQYQWAPTVGLTHVSQELDMTFAPLARYFMSTHANEEGAGRVRRLDLYPQVTKRFDGGWALGFWIENGISYNKVTEKWFVPVDVMLIKRLSKDLELMVGGAYGAVRDDPQYLTQVYGRLTFYF